MTDEEMSVERKPTQRKTKKAKIKAKRKTKTKQGKSSEHKGKLMKKKDD